MVLAGRSRVAGEPFQRKTNGAQAMTMLRFVRLGAVLIVGLLLSLVAVRWANSRIRPPADLGLIDGRLSVCPDRPNCISTLADDPERKFPPIPLTQPATAAIGDLASIIREMPRSRIVTSSENYLHAEFRSLLFGFVDDVEIVCDETTNTIHLRSAARVGYSDFDVNRQRAERIAKRYRQQLYVTQSTINDLLPE